MILLHSFRLHAVSADADILDKQQHPRRGQTFSCYRQQDDVHSRHRKSSPVLPSCRELEGPTTHCTAAASYFYQRDAAQCHPNPVSFWRSVYRSTGDGKRVYSCWQHKFAARAQDKKRLNYHALHSIVCFLRSG